MSDYQDFPSFFEKIRTRPAMWLGGDDGRSISALQSYLFGFQSAEEFHKIPPEVRLGGFDWRDFESWIEIKFNPKKLSCMSFGLARFLTNSEKEAFDLWCSWYDEYQLKINKRDVVD